MDDLLPHCLSKPSTLSYVLHEIMRLPLMADTRTPHEPHGVPLIAAVIHGRLRISGDGHSRIVQAGHLIMLPAASALHLTPLDGTSATVDLISYSRYPVDEADVGTRHKLWSCWHAPLPRLIRNLAPVHAHADKGDELQQLQQHIAFVQFMLFILQHREAPLMPAANRMQAVEQAIIRLQAEYHLEPPTLDEIAAEAGVSRRHFTALFRRLTHSSVNDYITTLRMLQAKRLLLKGEPLADIAQAIGYRDEFYFIRRFKQAVGQTPRQYANAQAKRLQIFIPSGRPQRVIADQYMGQLMKLGVLPVGVRTNMLNPDYLGVQRREACQHAGVADLGHGFPLCLQQVARLNPDLIVTQNEQQFADLQTVAPTVLIPYSSRDPLEKLRLFSRIFDASAVAERWITAYSERLARIRMRMSGQLEHSGTVTNLLLLSGQLYVLGPNAGYGSYSLYHSLRLPMPGRVLRELDETTLSKPISVEDLRDYAGHSLFLTCCEDPQHLLASEHWLDLPAVRNKRMYRCNPYRFAFEDPDSLDHQLDDLMQWLR